MALNDSLARFRLLQERNQATLSAIATTRTSSSSSSTKPSHRQPAPTPRPAAKPSPSVPAAVVRFSDDTARLRMINEVRTSTVGQQMKRVIDLLDKTREALTAHQINERIYVDIDGNRALAESLRSNPKVRCSDGRRYSYKPTHDVTGKGELLTLIKSFPDGLPVSEVTDAYPAVQDDLQALKASGDVYLLPGEGGIIAYPNVDPRSRMQVDAELKKLFHDVKLPREMIDIEKELRKNGEKPVTDTMKRRAAEQLHGRQPKPKKARKKSHGITSRTKLTNAHLPWLLDLPVDSKDFI